MAAEDDHRGWGGFARSVVRTARFSTIRPRLRRVFLGPEDNITEAHRHLHEENADGNDARESGEYHQECQECNANEQTALLSDRGRSVSAQNNSREFAPLRSRLDPASQMRVVSMAKKREESRTRTQGDEGQTLIAKVQRDDGTEAEVIVGQSTMPQVVFNSCNVLIGIGLLSLPLAIRYAGWVFGIAELLISAVVTKYTAGLLAKCMDVDSSLANFGDIAYVAFGERGRIMSSILITMELLTGSIGLIIILADTLESHIDGLSSTAWKVLCGLVLVPLQFVPMRWLGLTSFLGIVCSIILIIVAFVAGFLKPDAPGSLLTVSRTYAFPEDWRALPLSFGLIMSLWTAHCVFPNIYRDMRHPAKYGKGLNFIFSSVTVVDISMAVIGYLMFGDYAKDEITKNLITTKDYPAAIRLIVLALIVIVPITKFPLQASPIVSTLEVLSGVDARAKLLKPNRVNQSRFLTLALKSFFRVFVVLVAIGLAIVIPSFEVIAGVLGGIFGFLICIILPLIFHTKMFDGQVRGRRRLLDLFIIAVSIVLGVVGTVWEFLPRSWVGLE